VKYGVRTFLGLALVGFGILAANWSMYHLARTGTCASGGPYVSARPCPAGTGWHIMAMFIAVFASLIGMGVFAVRGTKRAASAVGLGVLTWGLFFVTLGVTGLVAAYGPAAGDDAGSKLGSSIVAGIFIPMGAIPIIGSFLFARSWRKHGVPGRRALRIGGSGFQFPSASASATATPPSGQAKTKAKPKAAAASPDPLERLKELADLRDRGVLTPEEFEAQKDQVLRDM
jgi:hypothetical protein